MFQDKDMTVKGDHAEFEFTIKPLTNQDVLIENMRNVHSLASSRVYGKTIDGKTKFYRLNQSLGYDTLGAALEAEEAWLLSEAVNQK